MKMAEITVRDVEGGEGGREDEEGDGEGGGEGEGLEGLVRAAFRDELVEMSNF